ncbi:hypothetical protein NXS19_011693 [Fusarium pseudograminearum]|nr:hypothetical protein NXS19_011693 [Fusarium pseudograminearum]
MTGLVMVLFLISIEKTLRKRSLNCIRSELRYILWPDYTIQLHLSYIINLVYQTSLIRIRYVLKFNSNGSREFQQSLKYLPSLSFLAVNEYLSQHVSRRSL